MEAVNEAGEQYGMERLRSVVTATASGTAQEVGEAVVDAVAEFAEGVALRDDATLVAVKLR